MRRDLPGDVTRNDKKYNGPKSPRNTKAATRVDEDGQPFSPPGMGRFSCMSKHKRWKNPKDTQVLYRWLKAQAGRPWSEVYHELCEGADIRSFVGHNVREALGWLVGESCHLEDDGTILDDEGRTIGTGEYPKMSSYAFYVHPTSGVLTEVPRRKRVWDHKPPKPDLYEVDGQWFTRSNHHWYRIWLQSLEGTANKWYVDDPAFEPLRNLVDALGEFRWQNLRLVPGPNFQHNYRYCLRDFLVKRYGHDEDGNVRYCTRKEAANGKEIDKIKKKYGLS